MLEQILSFALVGFKDVFLMFLIIWILHILLKNAGIVDVGWGLGFIILSFIYLNNGVGFNLRNILITVIVTLWGLRIMLLLLRRLITDSHEDRRYQKLRADWKTNVALKFFFFFEFQAVLQVILSLPFILINLNANESIGVFEVVGFLTALLALVGETIADEQLKNFKGDPKNKGKTCDVGLWHYSRHPNYFFEWVVWVGFFIFALGSPYGWTSIISPMIMYYLLRYVSGIPLAEEQSLRSRGDEYLRYQQSTSIFFPSFRKG